MVVEQRLWLLESMTSDFRPMGGCGGGCDDKILLSTYDFSVFCCSRVVFIDGGWLFSIWPAGLEFEGF